MIYYNNNKNICTINIIYMIQILYMITSEIWMFMCAQHFTSLILGNES